MSHTLDIQHIVFGTYRRRPTIAFDNREALYRFIWSKLKERKCTLYRINGIEDHLHMVIDLHPTYSKSKLIQEIKALSSQWMRKSGLFPLFEGWCEGYFSESKDPSTLDHIINYVKSQELHHKVEPYVSELETLHRQIGSEWDGQEMQ